MNTYLIDSFDAVQPKVVEVMKVVGGSAEGGGRCAEGGGRCAEGGGGCVERARRLR